jgi:hypothetical protein
MNVTTIMERIGHHLDLRRSDLDPEDFAAALAVQHLTLLLVHGGSAFGRPDAEDALDPLPLETFLDRAAVTARKVGRLAQEWHILQHLFPHLKCAWEEGQVLFQEDLVRVKRNQELLEYFSMIDFAVDCFASLTAMNAYPGDGPAQAWALNGYMVAWRKWQDDEGASP